MSSRATRPKRTPATRVGTALAPIPFPVFDDNRNRIVEWVDALEQGRSNVLIPSLFAAYKQLAKVRASARHVRLSEFVQHAALAIESGETQGARYILLTALAAFGWTSRFGE